MGNGSNSETSSAGIKAATALSAAIFLWGLNFVAAKFTVAQINPFAMVFLRGVLAAGILAAVVKSAGHSFFQLLRHWRLVLPLALTGIVGNQIFFLHGLEHTTASHSSLISTLNPIITMILAAVLLQERVTARRIIGILLAFTGAVMLATEGKLSLEGEYLYGDLVSLLGTACWALYTVLSKPVVARLGARRTMAVTYFVSLFVTIPLCVVPFAFQPWEKVSPLGWISFSYIVVFATVFGFLLHQYALRQLPAALVAAFNYALPVIAAAFAVLLLGEILNPQFFLAALFIFSGLVIARRRRIKGRVQEVIPGRGP
jgi:drug/metabolite transporter (DMT)-like permease